MKKMLTFVHEGLAGGNNTDRNEENKYDRKYCILPCIWYVEAAIPGHKTMSLCGIIIVKSSDGGGGLLVRK